MPLDIPVLSWEGVFWVIQAFQPCVAVVWASVVVGLALGCARVLALAGATWLSCRQQAWLASVEDMPVPTLGLGGGKKMSAGCSKRTVKSRVLVELPWVTKTFQTLLWPFEDKPAVEAFPRWPTIGLWRGQQCGPFQAQPVLAAPEPSAGCSPKP